MSSDVHSEPGSSPNRARIGQSAARSERLTPLDVETVLQATSDDHESGLEASRSSQMIVR
jgi:hypothetical protein